jgi:hypothetical protein
MHAEQGNPGRETAQGKATPALGENVAPRGDGRAFTFPYPHCNYSPYYNVYIPFITSYILSYILVTILYYIYIYVYIYVCTVTVLHM